MPVVIIRGVPDDKIGAANSLPVAIQEAVASQKELGITLNQVSVFIPSDVVQQGLGEELICIVEGLFAKPERTKEVLDQLALKIRETLETFAGAHLPRCVSFEVFVKRFNPEEDGFSSMNILPAPRF